MTQLTMNLAATHDHWADEPSLRHAGAGIKLWWRHLNRHHPLVVDIAEWCGAAAIAAAMLIAQLIVNA